MPVSQARKDGIVSMEFGSFIQNTVVPKSYKLVIHNGAKIYLDKSDGESSAKLKACKRAINTIVGNNFALPANLAIYCNANYATQNRAYHKGPGWTNTANITLGTTALTGGRADAISGMNFNGFDKGTVTTIHEIGHLLHSHARGDDFFDTGSNLTGNAATAAQVSGYAAQNKKEFVAEVFAGLMIGKHFSTAVMTEYMALGGPH